MLDPRKLAPLGSRILATRYERPDRVGSLIIPETARTDYNRTLWEVVATGPRVAEVVGHELREDDILTTPASLRGRIFAAGVYIGHFEGRDYFILEARDVTHVMRWKEARDDDDGC